MSADTAWRDLLAAVIAREAKPVEKFGHQPRLYALAVRVGTGMVFDDDVVYAAAWLHDLGVFAGHRPEDPEALARWDSVVYAVARAPGVLARVGFPARKVQAVLDCIENHQPGGDPRTIEGLMLRDADILEQLGAVGVLRTVCKVGRDTRFRTFTEAVSALRAAVQTLPGMLRLPSARRMAEEKVRVHRVFLEAVEAEAGELLL